MAGNAWPEIAYLFDPSAHECFEDFLQTCRFVGVLGDRLNNRILYTLYLCRFSKPYELCSLLGESSRAVISHRFDILINNQLMDVKNPRDEDFYVYWHFWKQNYERTREGSPFYIPTSFTDHLIQSLHVYWSGITSVATAQKAQRRGEAFQRYYQAQIELFHKKRLEREEAAMASIGACNRCSRNITDQVFHEYFKGLLFCRQCMREMKETGEWLQLTGTQG